MQPQLVSFAGHHCQRSHCSSSYWANSYPQPQSYRFCRVHLSRWNGEGSSIPRGADAGTTCTGSSRSTVESIQTSSHLRILRCCRSQEVPRIFLFSPCIHLVYGWLTFHLIVIRALQSCLRDLRLLLNLIRAMWRLDMTLTWAFKSLNRILAPIEDLLLSYSRLSDLYLSVFFARLMVSWNTYSW